jgi:hypothetical protein
MKKSTQWYISGAIWFCAAVIIYITCYVISARGEANVSWFGDSGLLPIQMAFLTLGPYIVFGEIVLGIVCLEVGVSGQLFA